MVSVDNLLRLSCCSVLPGGGTNTELALHCLFQCRGDVMVRLLSITPSFTLLSTSGSSKRSNPHVCLLPPPVPPQTISQVTLEKLLMLDLTRAVSQPLADYHYTGTWLAFLAWRPWLASLLSMTCACATAPGHCQMCRRWKWLGVFDDQLNHVCAQRLAFHVLLNNDTQYFWFQDSCLLNKSSSESVSKEFWCKQWAYQLTINSLALQTQSWHQ